MPGYLFTISPHQSPRLFSNQELDRLECWLRALPGNQQEQLRSVSLDLSGFNIREDLDVGFEPPSPAMEFPAVKTTFAGGQTENITFTFSRPIVLTHDQVYKISISNIAVNDTTLRSRELRIPVSVTTISGKNTIRRTSPESLKFNEISPVATTLKANPAVTGRFGKVRLSWQSQDAWYITAEVPGQAEAVSFPVPARVRSMELNMKDVFARLGLSNVDEQKRIPLHVKLNGQDAISQNINIVQYNMWYQHEIAADNRLIDLVTTECDQKLWGIAATPDENFLELWCCENGFDWEKCGVSVNWIALKDTLEDAILSKKLKGLKALSHLPPAIIVKKNENTYELSFIGGSKMEAKLALSTVFSCSFETGKNEVKALTRSQNGLSLNGKEYKIAGHCVTLFEYQQRSDCIWLMGGMAENGSGVGNILVLEGDKWTSLPNKAGFPARCQFSATVHTASGKKEIWVTGGWSNFNDVPVDSIWRYASVNGAAWRWEEVGNGATRQPLSIVDVSENTNANAIASYPTAVGGIFGLYYLAVADYFNVYAGKVEPVGPGFNFSPSHPKMYESAGGGWSDAPVIGGPGQPFQVPQLDSYLLQLVGFKGCIWLMAFRKYNQLMIISPLYYLKP